MEQLGTLLKGRLERDIYLTMMLNVPISTVDFVVRKQAPCDGYKFLLIKRNEGAFAKEWFVSGGRQFRGESQLEALYRIARSELGLDKEQITHCAFSHCQDIYNPGGVTTQGEIPDWHSVWHFHVVDVVSSFDPVLDSTASAFRWFDFTGYNFCEPVNEALARSKKYLTAPFS